MEEYYFNPDERKPWQKNVVIAFLVLALLYFIDVLSLAIRKFSWLIENLASRPEAGKNEITASRFSNETSIPEPTSQKLRTAN